MTSMAICSSLSPKAAAAPVGQRVGIEGAGVHQFDGSAERPPAAVIGAALVRAKFAAVFAGEGVAETVLEQTAGSHDDRRLTEVVEQVAELFHDFRREFPWRGTGSPPRRIPRAKMRRTARQLQAKAKQVVVDQEGEGEDVGADVERVVAFQDRGEIHGALVRRSPGEPRACRPPCRRFGRIR